MATLDDKSRSLIQKAYPEAIQAEADMIKLSVSIFPKAEVGHMKIHLQQNKHRVSRDQTVQRQRED